MRVLLTGGAGYIGSHTALVLLEQGHQVVVLDDLSNSSREAVRRVEALTGQPIEFVHADLTEPEATCLVDVSECARVTIGKRACKHPVSLRGTRVVDASTSSSMPKSVAKP